MTRIVESLLEPLGLMWILQLLLCAGFLWRRRRLLALLFGVVALLMFLVGSSRFPARLLATLERPYASRPIEQTEPAEAVIMLGGLLVPSSSDPLHVQFSDPADRLLTAVELVRTRTAEWLVLGGGGGALHGTPRKPWQEAELINPFLERWGVGTNVIRLSPSRNTREEAMQVKELMQRRAWRRVIVVTSAYHMKRATGIFRQLEIPIVPVACDFVGLSELESASTFNPVPHAEGFRQLELYLHEKLGWVFYRWRGWVTEER